MMGRGVFWQAQDGELAEPFPRPLTLASLIEFKD